MAGPLPKTGIENETPQSSIFVLHLFGLLLLWTGYFGPWVGHRAAALTMNAYDLAEWVTFLPGVRVGALPFGRLHFLAPLALAIGLTALFSLRLNDMRRWILIAFAFATGLLLLPGYPFILFWRDDPDVQSQLVLSAATWGSLLMMALLARIWKSSIPPVSLALAIGGFIITIWAMAQVRPVVAELYGTLPPLGWGIIVMVMGFAIVAGMSGLQSLRSMN